MMATAAPAKPLAPPQKVKRPPPPFVQTGANGVRPSQTTPFPLTIKRPPGLKQPPSSNSSNGVGVNGAASRATNRQRKETQKPGEAYRLNRLTTRNVGGDGAAATAGGRGAAKKAMTEPYVRDTAFMLKKYSKHPPSLVLHLHPTHFRFDQQDGSFGYNSPMKVLLEHIKTQTVPHDMLEELRAGNVRFYEGCLIVRILDHRSASPTASASSNTSVVDESNKPFSVHNWNEHVIPSPFAPYPSKNTSSNERPTSQSSSNDQISSGNDASAKNDTTEQTNGMETKRDSKLPRIFTTVLHPTQLSTIADMTILATTPDPRGLNRRQSQVFPSRTPASATVPHPPTPLSAVPQTPMNERGPPLKKQKMILEPKDFLDYEASIINATAPPLYLEPAENPKDAEEIIKFLRSDLHSKPPPSPKTRKRTVAELEADEAQAAEEERFILIMDERLAPSAPGAAASGAVDGQNGGFEPRFNRFKTLESIKLQQEEKARREHERKLQQDHLRRQQQEEQERTRKQQLADQARRDQEQREQARRTQALQQQMAAQHANVAPQINGIMPNLNQQNAMMHVSQGQHSSPVVRTQTPQHSSPLMGSMMGNHQSVPMNVSSSNPGAGSPPRPGSAVQHSGVANMAHSMSQNRSQQGPSRNGTPQVPQGTPGMQQATPIMRQVSTPTPRMTHASPNGSTVAQTPIMAQNLMATPQMGNVQMQMTPQQLAMIHARQQQMASQQQQMQAQIAGRQFTPQQIAQIQQQQQFMQQHGQANPQMQFQNGVYSANMRTQMQQQMQQQMANAANMQFQNQQQTQMHHGSPPNMGGQQMANGMPAAMNINQRLAQMPPQFQNMVRMRVQQLRTNMIQQAQQVHGPNLPELVHQQINRDAQGQAWKFATAQWQQTQQYRAAQMQQQQRVALQQQQQQQQQHGMMGGGQ